MTASTVHRLSGLEPDNLLAFLALLGLLRALEEGNGDLLPMASWSVDTPPVRPLLHVRPAADPDVVLLAAAEGLNTIARTLDFGDRKDLAVTPEEGPSVLAEALDLGCGELWSALVSDAAVARDRKKLEPTPLCVLLGQGHQHFLERLASVPAMREPARRGARGKGNEVSESACLAEALFGRWRRLDATPSFRWDHCEDVRYALRAQDPTDPKTKDTTQHGANRLAAIGLHVLTVAPRVASDGVVRLALRGGARDRRGRFTFTWPVWRHPLSLASICALLDHPRLGDDTVRASLDVVELRRVTRFSNGKFMNFSKAEVP